MGCDWTPPSPLPKSPKIGYSIWEVRLSVEHAGRKVEGRSSRVNVVEASAYAQALNIHQRVLDRAWIRVRLSPRDGLSRSN